MAETFYAGQQTGLISKAFAGAIVKAQGQIEGAKKDVKNDFFKSKYADLAGVWDACREALQANGIAVLQFPSEAPQGFVGLRTMLVYGPTGETLSEAFLMPLKDHSNPQAAGSALTYARRYALSAVIGICPEDDDGNAGAKAPTVKTSHRHESLSLNDGHATDHFVLLFERALMENGVAGAKQVYSTVKASALPEPAKTSLLANMAATIKKESK